jgi:hypothetical protein
LGLFTGIKKFFGKTIGIGVKQEGQLVYMYPVKNGRLKLNTEVEVKPGFVAVVMHYDTICDVLTEGKYKCSSGQMPKLNKYVKPRLTFRGYIAPKKVVADVYFINLGWFEKLPYNVSEPVPAEYGEKRYDVKFDGTFDMQVTNAIQFMKALLRDRATLRHGMAEVESGNVVSEEIYKTLVKFEQELEAYINRDSRLLGTIEEGLKDNAEENGFSVKNVTVNNVKLPKRLRKKLGIKEEPAEEASGEGNLEEFKKEVLQTKQAGEIAPEPPKQKVFVGGGNSEPPRQAKAASDYYEEIATKMNSGEIKPQAEPQIFRNDMRAEPAPNIDYGTNPLDMVRPSESSTLFNADGTPFIRPSYTPPPVYVQPQYEAPPQQVFVSDQTYSPPPPTIVPQYAPPPPPPAPKGPEIRCPQCSSGVPVGKKFCPDCGYNMQGFVVCSSCGAKNRFEDKTCMVCKSRL